MSTTVVVFTSSESFMEHDLRACERAEVEITGYLEATYGMLRHEDQTESLEFANFVEGAWELLDGRRFSDWAMGISTQNVYVVTGGNFGEDDPVVFEREGDADVYADLIGGTATRLLVCDRETAARMISEERRMSSDNPDDGEETTQ